MSHQTGPGQFEGRSEVGEGRISNHIFVSLSIVGTTYYIHTILCYTHHHYTCIKQNLWSVAERAGIVLHSTDRIVAKDAPLIHMRYLICLHIFYCGQFWCSTLCVSASNWGTMGFENRIEMAVSSNGEPAPKAWLIVLCCDLDPFPPDATPSEEVYVHADDDLWEESSTVPRASLWRQLADAAATAGDWQTATEAEWSAGQLHCELHKSNWPILSFFTRGPASLLTVIK